jgi:hypothetical protein
MTTAPPLVPAPALLIAEICRLLEYGLAKDCTESRALHTALQQARDDYTGFATVPLPAPLLERAYRLLLVLCIRAGADFAPGEKLVRFTRAADRARALAHVGAHRPTASRPGDAPGVVTGMA